MMSSSTARSGAHLRRNGREGATSSPQGELGINAPPGAGRSTGARF